MLDEAATAAVLLSCCPVVLPKWKDDDQPRNHLNKLLVRGPFGDQVYLGKFLYPKSREGMFWLRWGNSIAKYTDFHIYIHTYLCVCMLCIYAFMCIYIELSF